MYLCCLYLLLFIIFITILEILISLGELMVFFFNVLQTFICFRYVCLSTLPVYRICRPLWIWLDRSSERFDIHFMGGMIQSICISRCPNFCHYLLLPKWPYVKTSLSTVIWDVMHNTSPKWYVDKSYQIPWFYNYYYYTHSTK